MNYKKSPFPFMIIAVFLLIIVPISDRLIRHHYTVTIKLEEKPIEEMPRILTYLETNKKK